MIAPLLVAAAFAGLPTAVVLPNTEPQKGRVALTVDGRSWRDVSPPRVGWIDDATFIDASHGWVVSEDCALAQGRVARTTDGGQTWRSATFVAHSCSAGSQFVLDFIDAHNGWIVDVEGSGGFARLWRTTNAGRTWRLIVERMPGLGPVSFNTPTDGWAGGYDGLYRTRDAGRTWRRVSRPGKGFGAFVSPHFVSRLAITAAVDGRTAAAFRTIDGGRHWRRTLRVSLPSEPSVFEPVQLSTPAPGIYWLTVNGRRTQVYVSIDGGRTWTRRAALPINRVGPLQAIDAQTAVVAVYRAKHSELLVTHDGGRTWRLR
jgi:photosystem II stability/assembly factor-like uncharacterized protein